MIKVKLINLNINFTLFTLFTQFKKEIKELDTNNKSPQIEKENGRNQINSIEIDQKQNSNDNTLFDNNLPYTPIIFPFFNSNNLSSNPGVITINSATDTSPEQRTDVVKYFETKY